MNAKNKIASVSLVLVLAGGCQALLADNPNFSLHNISDKAIWISFGGKKGEIQVPVNGFYETVVSNALQSMNSTIRLPVGLVIFDENNGKTLSTAMFPDNKTVYITWDGAHIYSQSGSAGKAGGYSLDNNVKESDIRESKR
jgi:hypothetical protein